MKHLLVNLYSTLKNQNIVVSVGESSNSNCSGKLTVVIADTNGGQSTVLTKDVNNLGSTCQEISFSGFPVTGKLHPVVATLALESGQSKIDEEMIQLG